MTNITHITKSMLGRHPLIINSLDVAEQIAQNITSKMILPKIIGIVVMGRDGSLQAESIIVNAIKKEDAGALKDTINNELLSYHSRYEFVRFIYRDNDNESDRRKPNDIQSEFIDTGNGNHIINDINIKVTMASSADNICGWEPLYHTISGIHGFSRKYEDFMENIRILAEDDKISRGQENYFFWVVFKNKNSAINGDSCSSSLLSINPETFSFNENQTLPIQVKHRKMMTDADNEMELSYMDIPVKARRDNIVLWLLEEKEPVAEKVAKAAEDARAVKKIILENRARGYPQE